MVALFKLYSHLESYGEIWGERMQEPCCSAWFKCLQRATGSPLRRDECLREPHYGDEARSPLTCFLLHLCPIAASFLISDSEGKGWKFAFNLHGNLRASPEIFSCLSLAFSLGKQAFLPPLLFTHRSEVIAVGSGVRSLP